jgi:hypothetical protein
MHLDLYKDHALLLSLELSCSHILLILYFKMKYTSTFVALYIMCSGQLTLLS